MNPELTFEQAMARLAEIVAALENRDITLAESMALYKEGAELTKICRSQLETARHELEIWQNGQAKPVEATDLGDEMP